MGNLLGVFSSIITEEPPEVNLQYASTRNTRIPEFIRVREIIPTG
jgi:hypothetical protein